MSRGSRVTRVTRQLTDGSRGSRVKKCDPLSSLMHTCACCPVRGVCDATARRQSASRRVKLVARRPRDVAVRPTVACRTLRGERRWSGERAARYTRTGRHTTLTDSRHASPAGRKGLVTMHFIETVASFRGGGHGGLRTPPQGL